LGAAAVTILNFKVSSDQLEVTTYDVTGATFLAGSTNHFSLSPLFPGHTAPSGLPQSCALALVSCASLLRYYVGSMPAHMGGLGHNNWS
jgi:hypothetical protein